jgi:hypothetical protein
LSQFASSATLSRRLVVQRHWHRNEDGFYLRAAGEIVLAKTLQIVLRGAMQPAERTAATAIA